MVDMMVSHTYAGPPRGSAEEEEERAHKQAFVEEMDRLNNKMDQVLRTRCNCMVIEVTNAAMVKYLL